MFGSSPMKTKAPRGCQRSSSPLRRSRATTSSSRGLPRSSTTSVLVWTVNRGSERTLSWRSLRGLELGAELDDPDPLGELAEEHPLLKAGVAAADDQQLLGTLVEGTVTGRAEVDPGADQLGLPGHAQPPVRRAAGHQHRAGAHPLPAGQAQHGVVSVPLEALDRHRGQHLDVVAARLGDKTLGQLGTPDALGESRVVVHPLGDAGLSAQGAAVHDQAADPLARGVDGGGETRPAPRRRWPGRRRRGRPRA